MADLDSFAGIVAQSDQTLASFHELARLIAGFRAELLAAGLPEGFANTLTRDWQWVVLAKTNFPDESPMPPSSCD